MAIKRKMSCGVIMDLSVVFASMCCMYAAPGGTMRVLRMVRQGAPYACFCFKQGAGKPRVGIGNMLYNPPVLHNLVCGRVCKFAGVIVAIN